MRHAVRSLLLGLLVHAIAVGAPDAGKVIRDDDRAFNQAMKEFADLLKGVREKKLPLASLVKMYEKKTENRSDERMRAIHLFLHSEALRLAKRFDSAEMELEKAVRAHAAFPLAYIQLANFALEERDVARARELARKALAAQEGYWRALLLLGDLKLAEHQPREALAQYMRALDEPRGEVWRRIGEACMAIAHQEKGAERREYADKALRAANAYRSQEPKSPDAYYFLAAVHFELGKMGIEEDGFDRMVQTLEDAYRSEIPLPSKQRFLTLLLGVYGDEGDVEMVKDVLRRALRREFASVQKPEVRERYAQMLDDVEELGRAALPKWQIQALIEAVENKGVPVERRRQSLQRLMQIFVTNYGSDNELLADSRREIRDTIVRAIARSEPVLIVDVLVFFRKNYPDPRLMPILVHFVWPFADDRRTEEVRTEAVRTLEEVGGRAALPTLLYCLRDSSPRVRRAVDRALSDLFVERSPVGEGVAPLTEKQMKRSRRYWLKEVAFTETGTPALVEGFEMLRDVVALQSQHEANLRTIRRFPLADHVISAVVLENDMPFRTWIQGYRFLSDYLGRDFRPVGRRDEEVTPALRPAIVAEIERWWSNRDEPGEDEGGGKAGEDG